MKKLIIIVSLITSSICHAEEAVRITVEGLNIRNGVTNVVGQPKVKVVTDTNKVASLVATAEDAIGSGNRLNDVFRLILQSTRQAMYYYEQKVEREAIQQAALEAEQRVKDKMIGTGD